MIRIYGKGETVSSSEYWDGKTKYNLLQKFIQGDYRSYEDLIDPIKEILSQNFETFDFLERVSNVTVYKNGVFPNSLQNEFIISEDDLVKVTLGTIDKTYARLSPGIASYDHNIQIHKPATELGSKQLEQFFGLSQSDGEKVEIKYSYETDSFKCRIFKQSNKQTPVVTSEFTNGSSWDDDSSIGYENSAQLLADMYNDDQWQDKFVISIGDDLTKVNLELLVEVPDDGIYSWVMNDEGLIELTQDNTGKFKINTFTNTDGIMSDIDNQHQIYSSLGETEMDENGMVIINGEDGIKLIDDSGSEIVIQQNGDIEMSNGTVSVLLKDGDVVISGNLDVQGTKTEVSTQSLLVSDNIIEVNKDLENAPMAGFTSGLKINRGSEEDYFLLFDEDTMSFKIGTATGLQKVATREDTPLNTAVAFWNSTTNQFETSELMVWNGTQLIVDADRVDGLHANNNVITEDDTTLLTKNKAKAYIDEKDLEIQTELTNHKETTTNPHSVTQTQVGLSEVPNWNASTSVDLGLSNSTFSSQKAIKTYVDNKDTTIQNDVNQNEVDSKDRDTAIQNDVDQNEVDSKNRDTILQNNIDSRESESKSRDTGIQNDVDGNEVTSKDRDTILQNNIDSRETESKDRDTILQNNIDSRETESKSRDTGLGAIVIQNDIDSKDRDTVIQNDVNSNEQSSKDRDTVIQNDVNSNEQASKDRDVVIQNDINSNEQASKDRDTVIQNDVNSNEQASKDRDTTLQSNLDNHEHLYSELSSIPTSFNPSKQYMPSLFASANRPVGWYTIATNSGSRASARFGLRDTQSGDHQSVIFYAAHHYGVDGSNTLTVLDCSHFSGSPFRYIRIKENSTYDGAALQVYVDISSNTMGVYLLGDNFQSSGWEIKNWIPDATDPGGVTSYSTFTTKGQVDLDQIAQGGLSTTGPMYCDGNTTQYKVMTQNDRRFGSGTFNTTTGRTITHGLGRIPTNIQITVTSNPGGYLGEVWATKDATNIYVYCSGSTTTATFDWLVL